MSRRRGRGASWPLLAPLAADGASAGSASSLRPSCSHLPPEARAGSGISYLLRSQILRGEKCPQQAVPVTKELPNKRRAESRLACQNLWRKWLHNWKCCARSPGTVELRRDQRSARKPSEELRKTTRSMVEGSSLPGDPQVQGQMSLLLMQG